MARKLTLIYGKDTERRVNELAKTHLGPSASDVYRNCIRLAYNMWTCYTNGYTKMSMRKPDAQADGSQPSEEFDALMRYLFDKR